MSEYNDFVNGLLKQAAESLSPAIGITNPNSAVNSLISGATGINPGSAIGSWIQSNTGQLTERDRALMQWQEEQRSNEVQTRVKDMEAAGLNPALMYSKGVSSASMPSVPSSAPAASMSELLALATLPAQLKLMSSQADLAESSAAEKKSNTSLNEQLFDFNEKVNPLKQEAHELANEMSREQRLKIRDERNKIVEEMKKIAAETETEATKQLYNFAAASLADAESYEILQMLPYKQALAQAQTDKERAIAKLSAVQAAYQQGLINGGYLDAMCDQMKAAAKDAESKAAVDEFRRNISTGKAFHFDSDSKFGRIVSGVVDGVFGMPLAAFDYLLDKLNLGAIVGFSANPAKTAASNTVRTLSSSELDKYSNLIH